MKALPLLVGTTILVATTLLLTGNTKPNSSYPTRDSTALCNEVLHELRLYEPFTETLSANQIDQIFDRCRRRFIK